jgi:hypothetical protein
MPEQRKPFFKNEASRALVVSVLEERGYTLEEPKAYFDHHGVLDVLTDFEASRLGVALANFPLCFGMLSFGKTYSEAALMNHNVAPFLEKSVFQFFADKRQSSFDAVRVYRPPGWPLKALRFTGDKAQVMTLVGGPAILFDDGKRNVLWAEAYGHAAVLVRRWPLSGFNVVTSALNWQAPVRSWYQAHTPDTSEERLRMYSDAKIVLNFGASGCASLSNRRPSPDKAAVSTSAAAAGSPWNSGSGENGGDQKGGWGSGWVCYGGGDEEGGGESFAPPFAPWKGEGSYDGRWNGRGDEKGNDEKGGWYGWDWDGNRQNGGGEDKGVDEKGCWSRNYGGRASPAEPYPSISKT